MLRDGVGEQCSRLRGGAGEPRLPQVPQAPRLLVVVEVLLVCAVPSSHCQVRGDVERQKETSSSVCGGRQSDCSRAMRLSGLEG